MKNAPSHLSHAQMIEQHLASMHRRDAIASLQGLQLDIKVLQCELAVDKVFAQHNYEARL